VDDADPAFEGFVVSCREKLARAFAAAYGPDRGQEALAEALAYAWEHFDRLRTMTNPVGYLYRVGQSRSRRARPAVGFPPVQDVGVEGVEPALPKALLRLSERQRVCVVLLHAYGWTHQEVADLLGVSRSSVQNHAQRGLARLRDAIGMVVDG